MPLIFFYIQTTCLLFLYDTIFPYRFHSVPFCFPLCFLVSNFVCSPPRITYLLVSFWPSIFGSPRPQLSQYVPILPLSLFDFPLIFCTDDIAVIISGGIITSYCFRLPSFLFLLRGDFSGVFFLLLLVSSRRDWARHCNFSHQKHFYMHFLYRTMFNLTHCLSSWGYLCLSYPMFL